MHALSWYIRHFYHIARSWIYLYPVADQSDLPPLRTLGRT